MGSLLPWLETLDLDGYAWKVGSTLAYGGGASMTPKKVSVRFVCGSYFYSRSIMLNRKKRKKLFSSSSSSHCGLTIYTQRQRRETDRQIEEKGAERRRKQEIESMIRIKERDIM